MAVQRSYDDPTTPLHQVTFCVLDLETTGGSPQADAITEIGAVKVRGGEVLGTFHTLVNPGLPVADVVMVLTGITESMLAPAPPVHEVLPALGEFVGGAVLVGHNIRFDASFLDAALVAHGRPRLGIHRVDTATLARRLLRDDVANCKLGTLAERFGLEHRPCHRALDDALATVDLLHLLLERAAAFGVSALDDLLTLPAMAGHPHAAKLRLTLRLPRQPGVYLFRDRQGRPLYVGGATDLRSRVRSLFASDDGRVIGPLLRTAHSLDHVVCSSTLEAGVLEARLIVQLSPRYNRHGTRWRSYRYVKLTHEQSPRLAVVRAPRHDGAHYLGPLASTRAARAVIDAIETVVPLSSRRPRAKPAETAGTASVDRSRRAAGEHVSEPYAPHLEQRPSSSVRASDGSPPAPLNLAASPTSGRIADADQAPLAERVARGLSDRPGELLGPLLERIDHLAAAGRHDEAAVVREQAAALAQALRRQRRFDALRQARRIVVDLGDGRGAELVRGRLLRAWGPGGGLPAPVPGPGGSSELRLEPVEVPPTEGPVPCDLADELHYVAAWLDRHASRVRLVEVEGTFASPLPRITFDAARTPPTATATATAATARASAAGDAEHATAAVVPAPAAV